MTELEVSCGLPPGPDFAELAVTAEELGYARVWIFDSAPLWEDPFVHLALAAERTSRIGLATSVLIPDERSVLGMASAIATIVRVCGGRFRACFGTGLTARLVAGQRPMTLAALETYITALRALLAGKTAEVEGRPARLMHAPGLALARPIDVALWLSVFGPKGRAIAEQVADGIIGRPHPDLPSAIITWGTVLDEGEDPRSARVSAALAPWRVLDWHNAYANGGAASVDALPGGREWREALESLAPEGERHLLTFEGHVTDLTERDRALLPHMSAKAAGGIVGEPDVIATRLSQLGDAGYQEIIYTPTGPDISRELHAFAAAANRPDDPRRSRRKADSR
jgi:5,10-methylenetetrahydromethanopterin reductase